jgi:hypothetical protein
MCFLYIFSASNDVKIIQNFEDTLGDYSLLETFSKSQLEMSHPCILEKFADTVFTILLFFQVIFKRFLKTSQKRDDEFEPRFKTRLFHWENN